LRTLSSSDDQPSSFSEPAHGTTFRASGAGNGDSAGRTRLGERRRDVAAAHAGVLARDRAQLGLQPVDAGLARTGRRLIRRDDQRLERELAVQRAHRGHHRERGAVGVRDDPFGRFAAASGLTSGTTSGTSGPSERPGVVDGHGAAFGRDRRPPRADLVRHVEERDVDTVEDLGCQRLGR
jgi:hypothetical protein